MGSIDKKVDTDAGMTFYTARGEMTGREIQEAIWEFYAKGPITRNVLWDITGAELTALNADDVRRISQVPRKSLDLRRGGKTAIVAPTDLAYGLSRMYQASSDADELPFTVKVFRDRGKAQEWLAQRNSHAQSGGVE